MEAVENPMGPSEAPEVLERVGKIRELMLTRGGWKPGRTSFELAATWGISEQTVRKHAAEASRQIESCFGDKAEIRAKVLLLLEMAIEEAGELADDDEHEKSGKLLVEVAKQFARIAGLDAPTKVAITDTAGNNVPLPVELEKILRQPGAARFYLLNNRYPTEQELEHLASDPEKP